MKSKTSKKIVQDAVHSAEKHFKKYGNRKMSLKELGNLCATAT